MTFSVRAMLAGDLDAVERIYRMHEHMHEHMHQHMHQRMHRAREPAERWRERVVTMLERGDGIVALVGVDAEDRVSGYLIGEIRVWEFGSPAAGWIFALGVDRACAQKGLGSLLRHQAIARFRELGADSVRTMVRRDDVAVLRFFRNGGFRAGPYVELELPLSS